jgi:hypothetical protein
MWASQTLILWLISLIRHPANSPFSTDVGKENENASNFNVNKVSQATTTFAIETAAGIETATTLAVKWVFEKADNIVFCRQ